ncbi:hypothetical protein D3C87_2046340 [compost metagenome]
MGRRLEAVYQWKRALISNPEETEKPKIEAKILNGLPDPEPASTARAKPAEQPVVPPATPETDKKS